MASLLDYMSRLSISLYYIIICGEGGLVYSSASRCRRCRVLSFLVKSLIHDMFFSFNIGWCILSFLADEYLVGIFGSPKAS